MSIKRLIRLANLLIPKYGNAVDLNAALSKKMRPSWALELDNNVADDNLAELGYQILEENEDIPQDYINEMGERKNILEDFKEQDQPNLLPKTFSDKRDRLEELKVWWKEMRKVMAAGKNPWKESDENLWNWIELKRLLKLFRQGK